MPQRVFKFGKYKGKEIKEIILLDYKYVEWARTKIKYLLNYEEMELLRHAKNNKENTDYNNETVACRSKFEDEMYMVLRQIVESQK